MGMGVQLVEDNSLKATPKGAAIRIRLNWYRSLPLSCIEFFKLSIDGHAIPIENIRITINDEQYTLQEMTDIVEKFWFVQDAAVVDVLQPEIVKPGTEHRIEAEIALRFPYIAVGPGKFLVNTTKYVADQVAA